MSLVSPENKLNSNLKVAFVSVAKNDYSK